MIFAQIEFEFGAIALVVVTFCGFLIQYGISIAQGRATRTEVQEVKVQVKDIRDEQKAHAEKDDQRFSEVHERITDTQLEVARKADR